MIIIDNYEKNNLLTVESYTSGYELVRNLLTTEGSDAVISSAYMWWDGKMNATFYLGTSATAYFPGSDGTGLTTAELVSAINADGTMGAATVSAELVTWNTHTEAIYITAPIDSEVSAQLVRLCSVTLPSVVTYEFSIQNGSTTREADVLAGSLISTGVYTAYPYIRRAFFCYLDPNGGNTDVQWTGTTTVRYYAHSSRGSAYLLGTATGTMSNLTGYTPVNWSAYYTGSVFRWERTDASQELWIEVDQHAGEITGFPSVGNIDLQYQSDVTWSYGLTHSGPALGTNTVTRYHEYYTVLLPEYTAPTTIASDATSRLKYGTHVKSVPNSFIISANVERQAALANRLAAWKNPMARMVVHVPAWVRPDITERVKVRLRGQDKGIWLSWPYDAEKDYRSKEFVITAIREGQDANYTSLTLVEAGNIRYETEDDDMIIGGMCFYPGSVEPVNYLKCYGQELLVADYPELFANVDSGWLTTGNGTTTFNVPDMRGRGAVGLDNMGGSSANRITAAAAYTIGGSFGSQSSVAPHTHTLTLTGRAGNGAGTTRDPNWGYDDWLGGSTTATTASTGTSSGNVQPSVFGFWVIRAK